MQPLGAGQCGGGVVVEQQCRSAGRPLGALLRMQCGRAAMHVADAAQLLQCSTVQGNADGADSATRHPAGYGLWCYDGGATGGGATTGARRSDATVVQQCVAAPVRGYDTSGAAVQAACAAQHLQCIEGGAVRPGLATALGTRHWALGTGH